MEVVIGIMVVVFTFIGLFVLVKVNRKNKAKNSVSEEVSVPATDCCGAHEVCELDELIMDENRIEYYDDEELDEFKNTNPEQYSNKQIDQFREVLYTLKTAEIRYWLLSIERRKIQLPKVLVSEARMLMAEG